MPEKVDDCVSSVLEDNPELSESDAYAICNAQNGDGEAKLLAETEFSAEELDWVAENVDGYSKVETKASEYWVNGDDGVLVVQDAVRKDWQDLLSQQEDPCWEGYTMVGTKPNGNPRCVPEDDVENYDANQSATIEQKSFAGPAAPVRSVESAPSPESGASKLNVDELPDEVRDAVEADDFILYGKASIEQYDRDDVPTKLNMDAMEDALDRFFASDDAPGIISLAHQDIPVGRPVREYELDKDTVVELPNGEQYEFEAGETLRSEVRDDVDGDGRPEFWLVANLANDSDIARRTRLRALNGDLDGYSVTIKRNDDEVTEGGREAHELDLHAVTLGSDEQIKNPGSTFDVAEFKAAMPGVETADEAINAMADVIRNMTDEDNDSIGDQLRDKLGVGQKSEDGDDVGDDDSIDQKEDGMEEMTVGEIADEAGVPVADVIDMLEDVVDGGEGKGDYEDDEDDGDDPEDGEMKADDVDVAAKVEEKLDEAGVVTEDDLDSVATMDEVEEKLNEHQEEIADAVGEKLDDVMQKANVGTTPSPDANEDSTTNKVGDIIQEAE